MKITVEISFQNFESKGCISKTESTHLSFKVVLNSNKAIYIYIGIFFINHAYIFWCYTPFFTIVRNTVNIFLK